MKNLMKNLSKLFLILLVIPIVAISLSACKTKNDDPNKGNNEPIEEVDDNPNSPIKSGIYTFKNALSLSNLWYNDKEGNEDFIASYLGTRGYNGIRTALEKKGFLDFCTEVTRTNDNLDKVIEFDANNNVTTYAVGTNGFYTKLDSFTYVYKQETGLYSISSANANAPAITYSEETNNLKLYFEFKYYPEEDKNTCKFHKVYAEATLVYSCDSFESMTKEGRTANYAVKSNSAQIIKGETGTLSVEELNNKLANLFNLTETKNAVKDVESKLSEYKIATFLNFKMATIYKMNENSLTFSYNAISDQSLTVNGVRYTISTKSFAENPTELTVYIALDGDSIFQFVVEKV